MPSIKLDFPTPDSPMSKAFLLDTLPNTETKFSISSSCPIPKVSLSLATYSLIFLLNLFSMNV